MCLSIQPFIRDSNSSECTEFFVQIQLFFPHKFSNYHCFSPKRTHGNPLTVSSRVHKLPSITARSVFRKDPAGPLWKFPPLLDSVGNVLPRRSPARQPHPNSQLWPWKRRGGVFLPKSRSCNWGGFDDGREVAAVLQEEQESKWVFTPSQTVICYSHRRCGLFLWTSIKSDTKMNTKFQ